MNFDKDDTVIKAEDDRDITIKTKNNHQICIKEEEIANTEIVVKEEANLWKIATKKEDSCHNIDILKAVNNDLFNVKQEINFKAEDNFNDLNMCDGDITIKEEELTCLENKNLESGRKLASSYSEFRTLTTRTLEEEGHVSSNFNKMVETVENFLILKDKGASLKSLELTLRNTSLSLESLHSFSQDYSNNYKTELRKQNMKERKCNNTNEIEKQLYKMQNLPEEFDCKYDILNEISNKIKENSFTNKDNTKTIHEELTKVEKNMAAFPLYASYVKGYLYDYIQQTQQMNNDTLQREFKIGKTQLHYYLNFYKLIIEYNSLIRINLSFTQIVKNIPKIKQIIEEDEELKIICERKLPYFS